jgi:ribosomal protein S18 acetylase RimI-like enzyme
MRILTELRGIKYGLLEREDVGDMARVLGDVFSRRDPPAIAVGMSATDIKEFVDIFGPKALAEDLTIVARNSSGELVGAMFTEDFGTSPPADVTRAPASFAPVGALLDSLDDEYRATHPVVPGSHLHLFMVGVSDSFGGAGIAQTMITLCLTNGAQRGYRLAITEATSRTSQHIFRKLGFRDFCTRSYKEFLYEGRHVFESIRAHGGTVLMERSVGGAGAD